MIYLKTCYYRQQVMLIIFVYDHNKSCDMPETCQHMK